MGCGQLRLLEIYGTFDIKNTVNLISGGHKDFVITTSDKHCSFTAAIT